MAYPIREWISTERTTVTQVIRVLLVRDRQKSVTSMACEKLLKLKLAGSERIPEMLFVISDGCLNAITTAMYNGKTTVLYPRINKITTFQLV